MSDTYTRDRWSTDAEREVTRAAAQSEVAAQAMTATRAYNAWIETEAGQAFERMTRPIVTHAAFDAGWEARDQWARHEREWQKQERDIPDVVR